MKKLLAIFLLLVATAPAMPAVERLSSARAAAVSHAWSGPLRVLGIAGNTGSMRPYITGGETLLCDVYYGQPILRGDLLVFDRGDHPRVLHEATAVNPRAVYMSGLNNRYSDGWFPNHKVRLIVRRVIRVQAP